MLNKTDHHNPNPHNCPFVEDSFHLNRYICLKNSFERQLNNRKFYAGILALILLFSVILLPIANPHQPTKELLLEEEQPLMIWLNHGVLLFNIEGSFKGSSLQFTPQICHPL